MVIPAPPSVFCPFPVEKKKGETGNELRQGQEEGWMRNENYTELKLIRADSGVDEYRAGYCLNQKQSADCKPFINTVQLEELL